MNHNKYESPLSSRYASDEMQYLFSPDKKFSTWRRLWIALARAEMELGLPVTQEQVDELEAHLDDIDYDSGRARRKRSCATTSWPTSTPMASSAPRPCPSSTWAPPAAMWETTPM